MKYFVARGETRRLDSRARAELRGSYIELTDGVTHYELAGPHDGPLVVLAGGLTVPLFYWDAVAEGLQARGLRTLTYSGYGRGFSDRVHGRYDEALFVRQLGELIETVVPGERYDLVGASMGALIALAYAAEAVTPPATLTLAGPAGLSSRPILQKVLLGNDITATILARSVGRRVLDQHTGHNVREPDRASALAQMLSDPYSYEGSLYAFFATLRDFALSDRAELYRRAGTLGLPTLLLWGDEDDVTPISALDTVTSLLRPEEVQVITGCGHMVPFERPVEVTAHLAAFIASHSGRHPS
ncbi:alpha/beta hydrolase [Nocardia sp. NPDC050697]|uniref:alpha/beta fold hydrolase n=1 Tax=Nocardia sp. NPDC050697 TaxID=3155158 RepID=UPI0033C3D486